MKRLLVPLLGDSGDRPALDLAASVVRRHGGHIDATVFRRDPRDMIPLVGDGFNAGMIESLMEAGEAQAAERETAARATYDAWRQTVDASDQAVPHGLSASFSSVTGPLPNGVARPARAADLTVFARTQPEAGMERRGLIETAMFDSGRPVLLGGSSSAADVGRRVVIGWNGSAEAARSVSMAMPLLSNAESVTVIVVDDGNLSETPDDLVRTLTLWGVSATGITVAASNDGIAATLEAEAVKAKADMILLGAYSHSRVREFVMGGVTDDALTSGSIAMMLAR